MTTAIVAIYSLANQLKIKMVLHSERYSYPYSSSEQSYSSYHQGSVGSIQGGYGHTNPYSQHHQSSWSNGGGGYHGNGANHHFGSGGFTTMLPNTGPYDHSYYHGHSGHNSYGNGSNYGYQQTSWTHKNLDNE
ncbi:hypothetical protein QVD17_40691 [Tagetes erecta]|uniref:Uncharacterized protein n=1 Tax=Tagetes erecta TaxID=13708 RepID=A0AAD8JRQ0_TARER|nr:hypothetical protein QVD17_40691 [Tagetes erecta]